MILKINTGYGRGFFSRKILNFECATSFISYRGSELVSFRIFGEHFEEKLYQLLLLK